VTITHVRTTVQSGVNLCRRLCAEKDAPLDDDEDGGGGGGGGNSKVTNKLSCTI